MACWDALAKALGVPLAVLLGGTVGPVQAYNSDGLGLAPPDRLADEALALLAEGGFRGLKVRVGRERLAEDLAAVRAVRAAVGDDVLLMLDFNQGLTLGEALRRCRALDAEGVTWIEEPIAYDDLAGNARIARETATPIQIGENFYGPRAMLDALAAQACDLVMPDLMRIGGVTGWLRAAALAVAWGIDMSTHLYPEVSSHLMRVTPTAHWLEWQDWASPVLAHPFPVKDGLIHPRDVPGNGLEWDEEAVRRHAVDC
jgi:mandelate racemase